MDFNRTMGDLTRRYSLEAIEGALVAEYMAHHKRETHNRLLLTTAAKSGTEDIRASLRDVMPDWTLGSFLTAFELAIPPADRSVNGAYYTPAHIVDEMAKAVIIKPTDVVCDPSCGAGAFLIGSLGRLRELGAGSIADILTNQLVGNDILDYSIRHARILLALYALEHGEDAETFADRLSVGDSLNDGWRVGLAPVDVVIGNPPYVRYQDLPVAVREATARRWKTVSRGNFNLYFVFFELGLEMLKDDGRLAFIAPNTYFTSLAAEDLRELLGSGGRHLRAIVDFGELPVFDASTYTAITFLRKTPQTAVRFARADRTDASLRLLDLRYDQIPLANLDTHKWRVGYTEELEVIRNIETRGTPLGKLARVSVGIATLKDSVFMLDGGRLVGDTYLLEEGGVTWPIEAKASAPLVKISDHADQASLDANQRRIILPYDKDESGRYTIIPEAEIQRRFPGCYAYLSFKRDELAGRDKGAKEYEAWYAYGRRQGLDVTGPKLFTTTFSLKPRFLIDTAGDSMFTNGYSVVPRTSATIWKTTDGLRALARVLNSDLMDFYTRMTSAPLAGGYRCYQKNFIETFGVPDVDADDIVWLLAASTAEVNGWVASGLEIDDNLLAAVGIEA